MARKRVEGELLLENIRMMWTNFAGEKQLYNESGKRVFSIPLEEPLAKELEDLGWKVVTKPQDDGSSLYHLTVTVKLDGKRPAKLFMITKSKNSRTPLDEDTAMLLDYAEFDTVDVIIRPYNWGPIQGQYGVAAYLKTGFFTIHEDDLELKYAHVPLEGTPPAIENVIDVEGEWVEDDEADAIIGVERKAIEA